LLAYFKQFSKIFDFFRLGAGEGFLTRPLSEERGISIWHHLTVSSIEDTISA